MMKSSLESQVKRQTQVIDYEIRRLRKKIAAQREPTLHVFLKKRLHKLLEELRR